MGLFKNLSLSRNRSGVSRSGSVIGVGINAAEQAYLERMMKEFPEKVFRKVVKSAAMYAMTPVLKSAKKLAPMWEGKLRGSLTKKAKSYPKNHTVWVGVGPRKREAPHAHLLEFGHRLVGGSVIYNTKEGKYYRTPGRKGKLLGFVPPHPFLRPAFEENKASMLQRYRDKLVLGIEKEAKG